MISGSDVSTTPAINSEDRTSEIDTTSDLEPENGFSDENVITDQVEASADTSPDDIPVGDSSEHTSSFDSEMPSILNLQTAGLRRSPRIAAQKSRPWYT